MYNESRNAVTLLMLLYVILFNLNHSSATSLVHKLTNGHFCTFIVILACILASKFRTSFVGNGGDL